MNIRIGINGFGRIGRLAARVLWDHPGLELVHVNEVAGDVGTAAQLLEFDTVHGRWGQRVAVADGGLEVAGRQISFTQSRVPGESPWADRGVDVVLECSGQFRSRDALQPYFDAGLHKVVVSAPVKDADLNIVVGCNDHLYDPEHHHLVTAASCTTNALGPVVKVIHEGLGIRHGLITTIHDITNTQVIVDAPHKDPRRARSALNSLIPTTTGSAKAIGMIFPELNGKFNGIAVRVPVLNASLVDAVFEVDRGTTVEEVNGLFETAAEGPLKGILGYETRPLVSADYVNDPRSGIVDAGSTMVIDGTQVKVLAWYDNEFGYATRLVDLAEKVAQRLTARSRAGA